jgi:diaminohydroxyphosphoribosylaminopyrimidine deaminase/5-amino-6-(5-phosphoribosylamino)uracil reductase
MPKLWRLREAGEKARGATLYVNLEPCCHTGRTGPCTKAIIAAGVRRVVAAMEDPNPEVAGQGFAELRTAGLHVTEGVEEDEAMRLNEDFACWIKTQLPFVTLKAALTLDGQIAMRPGHETAITDGPARDAGQRLRHAADAVLTGIGTVLADDPLLTDRTGLARRRKLLRVVVDSNLRITPDKKIVESAEEDVVVFTAQACGTGEKSRAIERAGVEVVSVPAREGHCGTPRGVARARAAADSEFAAGGWRGTQWRGHRRGNCGQDGAFLCAEDHGNRGSAARGNCLRAGFSKRLRFRD